MLSRFFWVDSGWPGRLALSARPRGDDWIEDDLANWKREGIDAVVSLLTPEEEENLGLKKEAAAVKKQNMDFFSFPIRDLQVPRSRTPLTKTLEEINAQLSSGKNVLVHCRQGIGRTGMVAACLLVTRGWSPSAAVDYLSTLRGTAVPETPEQRSWIDHFAATLAGSK
jgi:protein-tyrosine phosphatase